MDNDSNDTEFKWSNETPEYSLDASEVAFKSFFDRVLLRCIDTIDREIDDEIVTENPDLPVGIIPDVFL